MSKKIAVLLLAAGMAMAAGCKSETDNKAAAKVSEASAEEKTDEKAEEAKADEKADEAKSEPREVAVATDKSSIGWVGAKVTGDHKGGFKKFEGKLWENEGEVEKVEFTVDTTSVFSDAEKLTGHLKSDDFFHVEKHPEAKFVSKKIVEKKSKSPDGKEFSHEVTGDFTIRGVTKELTFPANIKAGDDKLEASTEFTFNRFDFDIVYKGKPDDLIKKEVLLKVDLVAPMDKQAEKPKQAEAEAAKDEAGK
ncbi:YceI family protein [Persicimonas caeni]|uniref:YceI family protein n=1 Tax=Persicimonas caeni TaxID=2292766 RepID=A0A4Y6PXJ4_PERCE|nr:YceI family protein [Persicimonas caeni]QDG53058.1 YceI family protein [Persicimonas caeni]QED34280.1 YceI family protein [Persicimonas caeni]